MFLTWMKKKKIHILLLFIYVNDSYEKKPRVMSHPFFISWTLKGILHPIFWWFVWPALNSWNSFSEFLEVISININASICKISRLFTAQTPLSLLLVAGIYRPLAGCHSLTYNSCFNYGQFQYKQR